jgi:hypothetical protein
MRTYKKSNVNGVRGEPCSQCGRHMSDGTAFYLAYGDGILGGKKGRGN